MKYIFIIFSILFLLPAYGQKTSLVKSQLQGRWVSADDKKAVIVFKDTLQQDFYAGELLSILRYWVKNDSLVTKDLATGDVFYYAIMGMTKEHLTLMYLERGNLLKYRKQTGTDTLPGKKRTKH